jgi:hypothetical protein
MADEEILSFILQTPLKATGRNYSAATQHVGKKEVNAGKPPVEQLGERVLLPSHSPRASWLFRSAALGQSTHKN